MDGDGEITVDRDLAAGGRQDDAGGVGPEVGTFAGGERTGGGLRLAVGSRCPRRGGRRRGVAGTVAWRGAPAGTRSVRSAAATV